MSSSQAVPAPPATKACPYCAETIKAAAVRCKHCHADLATLACGGSSEPGTPAGDAAADSINAQVIAQSSTKVGICLTLLGLMRAVEGIKEVRLLADEMLAVNTLGFVISNLISYAALKERTQKRKRLLGRVGDLIFPLRCACWP